jgi:hypothetical protein
MKKLISALSIAAIAGAACGFPGGDDALSEMTLEKTGRSGAVVVARGGETTDVTEAFGLEPGDVITTTAGAGAHLRLEGDREAWIGSDSAAEVVGGAHLANESGSVLTDTDEPMTISFGDVEAVADEGAFRIDQRDASSRAGSYAGTVTLDAPGQQTVQLAPFFQSTITAGRILPSTPYRLDVEDGWDRTWLDGVIELDTRLDQLASGFTRQIATSKPKASFFRVLAGGGNVSFIDPYLNKQRRSAAELVIAVSIAKSDASGDLKSSFTRAFGIRDAGATWGLTATIMRIEARRLVAQLAGIILDTGAVASKLGGGRNGTGAGSTRGGKRGGTRGGGGDGSGGSAGGDGGSSGGGTGTGGTGTGGTDGGTGGTDGGTGGTDGGTGGTGTGGTGTGGTGTGGTGGGGGGGGDDCADVIDCTVEELPLPLPTSSPIIDLP